MKGRPPTAEERRFQDEICTMGCIVCHNNGILTPMVTPHHIDGRTKPGAHFYVIPLCGNHHQMPDSQIPPRWWPVHPYKAKFEESYGSQHKLFLQAVSWLIDNGYPIPKLGGYSLFKENITNSN